MRPRRGWPIAVGCALVCLAQAGVADAARLNPFLTRLAEHGALASPRAAASLGNGSDTLINEVACTGAGDCGAAGDYLNALGDQQGVLFTESNGAWSTGLEAALPSNAASNGDVDVQLSSIACASAGNCTAVGEYSNNAQSSLGLMLTQVGGAWQTGVEVRLPANAITDAEAPGRQGDDAELTSVSCWAAGDCLAVGGYEDSSDDVDGMLVSESGGVWSPAVEVTLPAAGYAKGVAALNAVSCPVSGVCTASGAYTNASDEQEGWVVNVVSGTATNSSTITLPGDAASSSDAGGLNTNPEGIGSSISCADADDCLIGGSYSDELFNTLPLIDEELGGVWTSSSPVSSPGLPAGARSPQYAEILSDPIDSVACPAAGGCTAVGWYTDADDNTQGLLLTEQGGSWTSSAAVLPADANTGVDVQTAEPGPVACASAGNCIAASDYDDTVGNVEPLILTESGYAWATGFEPSLPANAGPDQQYGGLGAASCPAGQDGDCTTVGIYQDKNEDVQAFALTQLNGLWGASVELGLPSPDRAEVKLSLKPVLSVTGKSDTIADIDKAGAYSATFVSVETGKMTADWYEKYQGKEQLVASATKSASGSHSYTVKLKLTGFGHQRLSSAKKLTITAKGTFKPKTGSKLSATDKFKLS